ncbi:hypothetical protein DH2020_010562 [Rehmannia glutinosa]|uniref:Pyruvate kinase n=1 Tax=Rehmannia glutinosa TaxID=99300 RepID=A0ABR0XB05_REHGL
MVSNHLLLEEPIRMASILEPSKPHSFDVVSATVRAEKKCLILQAEIELMLDTVGPELQVVNKTEQPISLEEDSEVILTPDQDKEATSHLLPINFTGLSKAVKTGDTIFIGQYLFTGSETTSVWLEVIEVKEKDVVCMIKNSATLAGPLYTLHVSQIRIELPTLTEKDKEAREFISKLGDLSQTQIFAKIENVEVGLIHFDEILQEADGIILSRGNLGIDLPPEKVCCFLFQKEAVHKCNMAGKPAVVTRVVDSGDAILLGAETLRGLYPVETISIVVMHVVRMSSKSTEISGPSFGDNSSHQSALFVTCIKVKASVIICFTSSGRAARLIAKYRPTMPVISVVIPRLKSINSTGPLVALSCSFYWQARQSLIVRGLFPMLADPRHPVSRVSQSCSNDLKDNSDFHLVG